MSARALVFGAGGFIGRRVVHALHARGASVIGVVRDAAVARDALHRRSVSVPLVEADLAVAGSAAGLIRAYTPSVVFNLAGYGVDHTERDEELAERMNHGLVRELAESCAPASAWPAAALVHVGSALEYGTWTGVLDEAGPCLPTTAYGRTKLAGTQAVTDVARTRGTRAITARLFTVFGEGEHEGRLFPAIGAAARAGVLLPLTDGRQPRDFAFVGDVANALVRLADAAFDPGDVVNVGSGRLYTVQTFIREVARQVGLPESLLGFGMLPTRAEEMWPAGVSVERMTRLLGARLPGDLREIVQRAVRDAQSGSRPAQ